MASQSTRNSLQLSSRDRQILDALATQVRAFTVDQVAAGYFAGDQDNARRRLRRLAHHHWLDLRSAHVRLVPPLEKPLWQWAPGEARPNYGAISARLRRRWSNQPNRSIQLVGLGATAAKCYGLRHRKRIGHPLQLGHDIALTEVFLLFREQFSGDSYQWLGEDAATRWNLSDPRAGAVPDALLLDDAGNTDRAIELGGLYSPQRIATLHQAFSTREIGYEIW